MEDWKPTLNWIGRLYLWATYRLYDELAWAYDLAAWLVSLGQWDRWRKQSLEHIAGERILEVGFGTGELLGEMARRGLEAVGLDRSWAMQRVTGRKMRRRGWWALRVCAMTQAMPFAAGSFDTVVATFPAEYILDPATLGEVARVLVEGRGRMVIVGMGIEVRDTRWRHWGERFFGVRGEAYIRGFKENAARCGLTFSAVQTQGEGRGLPVILLEKRA